MARLSRTGGKASKARVRKASPAKGRETTNTAKAKTTKAKTTKTRRRIVLETGPRKPRSVSDLVAQLDLRTKQLDESLAQQTATGEILTVINGSAGNLAPVFDIILEKAHSLCGVTTGSLELYEGDIARSVAARGMNKRWEKYLREGYRITEALRPAYQSLRPGHVDDMRKIVERFPDEPTYRAFVEIGHLRTFLALPLVREDIVIGRIVAARAEVEPFTDGQIKLLQSFADQAVIAIDNVRLFNETKEALEQQKASADILSVISNSVADTQPVFDKILESCKHLFGGDELDVLLVDEQGQLNIAAYIGDSHDVVAATFPAPVERTPAGRAIRERRVMHWPDLVNGEDVPGVLRRMAKLIGYRSMVFAPMLWEGRGIGAIGVARSTGPFKPKELAMIQTFADQAVIAIQNARLFNETREALERQTATSEILRVISQSPTDVQPVFDAIVQTAVRLIRCDIAFVLRCDGATFSPAAAAGPDGPLPDLGPSHLPIDPGANFPSRAIVGKENVHLPDWSLIDLPEHERQMQALIGVNSALFLPLLREAECIGVLALAGKRANIFGESEIALAESFRDQALIAIENVRLFNETREALERQTATADILKVISSSVADTTPVFEQILDSCERLAAFNRMAIFLLGEDGQVHIGAYRGGEGDALKATFPQPLANTPMSLAFERQQALFFGDVLNNSDAPESLRIAASRMGSFSVLVAPLLWEGRGIGAFHVARNADATFSDREVALLKTFADQAAIAIQNARLFNETREALERQTATADILKVIASSPNDEQPVFQAIAERSKRLVDAQSTAVFRLVDGMMHLRAFTSISPEADANLQAMFPAPLSTYSGGETIRRGEIFSVVDTDAAELEGIRAIARLRGFRGAMAIPLLHDEAPIGFISVTRVQRGPFADHHVQLLQTFADQAVIAIQNARLFNETQEALERQTATADILKVIASSPSDLQPVFEAIAERSNRLVGGLSTTVLSIVDDTIHLSAFTRTNPQADAALTASFPIQLSTTPFSEPIRQGAIYSVPDTETEPALRDLARMRGYRSMLFVPLLRDGAPIGMIGQTRVEPGPFPVNHIQLLKTFADQAGIAISNVRLFQEVRERTRELSQSLDDLRTAQDRLVQTEKLASLGQLTAGIAHEIKNPLNFVNNFSALSVELIDEMTDVFENPALDEAARRKELDEIRELLKSNLEKVVQHGKRADSIVKNMLLHSREGSGEQRAVDINALLEESLNLAYHGARAEKPGFNITLRRDLDPDAGAIDVFPQEITRAFINLISNGFYAASKRKAENGEAEFEPVLSAATKNLGNHVEIRIRDNGTGIPSEVKEKIFNPFFTTKPAGEGTGLGLSMSHDIFVKQHGGTIDVDSESGIFTEFIISLPRTIAPQKKAGGTI